MASSAVWTMIGGATAVVLAGAIPDPQKRTVVRGAGVVAFAVGVVLGIDEVKDFLGLGSKLKSEFTSSATSPIENIDRGAEGATGVLGAFIKIPQPGQALDRNSGTYPIKIQLSSSLTQSKTVKVELQSKEFYSFGTESDGQMQDFGNITVPAGNTKVLSGQIRYEATGPINPWYPPEVSLTLFIDGAPRDNVRFTYE